MMNGKDRETLFDLCARNGIDNLVQELSRLLPGPDQRIETLYDQLASLCREDARQSSSDARAQIEVRLAELRALQSEEAAEVERMWRAARPLPDVRHDPDGADIEDGEDEDSFLIDNVGFADPGGNSALRAETPDNPRNLPCPTCGTENVLTPKDRARGYQCNRCADRAERGGP